MIDDEQVICPECGAAPGGKETQFGTRHECCGLHSWDGKALATPSTHLARQAAHASFDALWKSGMAKRNRCYRLLAKELGVPKREAHMSIMPEELALRVPAAVGWIRRALEMQRDGITDQDIAETMPPGRPS